ncbi:hypothetical protein PRLR6025_16070 [Prevotella lacticifex]|nr:hypothetical protein PRLR6025_16070 [Prevotella lacticifex]
MGMTGKGPDGIDVDLKDRQVLKNVEDSAELKGHTEYIDNQSDNE